MNMPTLAKVIGILLTLLGIIAYTGSGMASITAMIPAIIGAPLFLLGSAARNERWRKHMMHAAATLALIGLAGACMRMISSAGSATPFALVTLAAMALLCLVFLVFAVRSFILARTKTPT